MKTARVDFFKKTGKYYTTENVALWDPKGLEDPRLWVDGIKYSVRTHLNGRLAGMVAVVLEPDEDTGFPVMFNVTEEEL